MNPMLLLTLYSFLNGATRKRPTCCARHPCSTSSKSWVNQVLGHDVVSTLSSLRGFASRSTTKDDDAQESTDNVVRGNVTILDQNEHYLVVAKTPAVVCHHSEWTGSWSRQELPMIQRVRQATGGRHVNLVHRLDRGCSGCLLMTWRDAQLNDNDNQSSDQGHNATRILNAAMQAPTTVKTYVALVRGEGILHGRDFRQEGWFTVDRPITNERGNMANATTLFRFVAGQDNGGGTIDRPRASLVLCRPATGRWHQIRKHLQGLSHPILGDSTHGSSKINREYRQRYGMQPERTCLHLARIDMEPIPGVTPPHGIHVACPLAQDMRQMLQQYMPDLLEAARPVLRQEGVWVDPQTPETAHSNKVTVLPFEFIQQSLVEPSKHAK